MTEEKDISPEMRQLLEEEAIEAEIEGAMDAALEEGYFITREEAIKILNKQVASQHSDFSLGK